MRKFYLALVSLVALMALTAAPAAAKPSHPGTCTPGSKGTTTCVVTTQTTQTHLMDSWEPTGNFVGYDSDPFVAEWCNAVFPSPQGYTWTKAWTWQNEVPLTDNNGAVNLTKTTTTTTATTYKGNKVVSQSTQARVDYGWSRVTADSQLDCLDDAGHSVRQDGPV